MESETRLILRAESSPINAFPIVGIGASAGGLEAFTHLLTYLPNDAGMAYVLVQHMEPTHKSLLVELLMRTTSMAVCEASEGMEVLANHIYVIAPNTDLSLSQGRLHLIPQTKTAGQHLSIDTFLISLAENMHQQAIGVILSGTGSDGTRGLQAIKAHGGMTFAQTTSSAHDTAMPQHAINAGFVDFTGSPEEIAHELVRISSLIEPSLENTDNEQTFQDILQLLSQRTQIDFTLYKPMTLKRRVQHRMSLLQIHYQSAYLTYLYDHQEEIAALSQDLLIGVTAFFRDPTTYQALVQDVFPRMIASHSSPDPLRIWVPGCSTGEEVYSLAISLQEFLHQQSSSLPFQIFGTDLNAAAIDYARKGLYPHTALSNISPERRERFFLPVHELARITPSLREHCVFAQHNLLKDPPLSRLDLVSCQNVLIYLGLEAQKKSFQLFHYSLAPHGFLLLGRSETIGTSSDLFVQAGQNHHIYLKKARSTQSWFVRGSARSTPPQPFEERNDMHPKENIRAFDIQKETDRLLLARYTPASVVVNAEMEILQFRGPTHLYLQPASGKASFNLFKMARESLSVELRTSISKARKSGQAVKKEGIQLKDQDTLREVKLEVMPMQTSTATEIYFIIVFEEMPPSTHTPAEKTARTTIQPAEKTARNLKDRRIQHLEKEVQDTREQMHTIIEELEAANEELQSANEEILSSNEELRSLNEELETSKEEIQASNEGLFVVNQELKQSNISLNAAREYADAIVETIHEPLLVLDAELRVQHANPAFYQFFQVEPAQTEHYPLFELENRQWDIPALRILLEELLPKSHSFTDFTLEHNFPLIGRKTMLLNAHRIDHVPLILLAMEDITALTQAVKEKQQLLSQREEFMAIASHELKTPVTSLKGYTQMLHNRFVKAGDEHSASLLAKMDERINKLVALVNELLDVTTIEAGKLYWYTEAFDLNALVRESVEEALQTTQQHQIHVQGTLPALVIGNPERISQVLTNLLSNAIKYSPRSEAILVTLHMQNNLATVGVQDFGIGITQEQQEHLFERFFRVSEPKHTTTPGLGLGLYISAEIVKRLGGRMWVESSPDKGSTFFFTIPSVAEGS